jgi:FkbM family methyltransferase
MAYLWECGPVVAKRTRHGLFAFLRNDAFIGRSLDLYGEWCEGEIAVLRQIVRPGDTVVDVGANIGTHTAPLAAMVGPSGVVHAFEPQRIMYQLLCGNLALNGHMNVRAYQAGAGASAGAIMVPSLPALDAPANFGAIPLAGGSDGEPGQLMTLDSLRLTSCRLIKVDVEGMEAAAAGAGDTLRRLRPALYVENDRSGDVSRRTITAIFEHGYRAYWHIIAYFDPGNFFGNQENAFGNIVSANLVCLPRESGAVVGGMPECTGPDDTFEQAIGRLASA